MFVHSSVDGHLECLDLLAVVNSAVVNYVYTFFFFEYLFSVLFIYILREELLCYMVFLC